MLLCYFRRNVEASSHIFIHFVVVFREKKRRRLSATLVSATRSKHVAVVIIVLDFDRPRRHNSAFCEKHQFVKEISEIKCYASAALAVMQYLSVRVSVCLSVTFVDCVKTNKNIFKIFSPSGSRTILVFPYQTAWQYSDGNPR